MKVANIQSSTGKLKRLFNVLLRGKDIFEYFLFLFLANLMKRVVANVKQCQLPNLDSATPEQFGCDELAN